MKPIALLYLTLLLAAPAASFANATTNQEQTDLRLFLDQTIDLAVCVEVTPLPA